jgi:hypothetical protein
MIYGMTNTTNLCNRLAQLLIEEGFCSDVEESNTIAGAVFDEYEHA